MNDFKKQMQSLANAVEKGLLEYLPSKTEYPFKLHEAMHYSSLSGGKRIRSIMVLKSAELFGMSCQKVLPTACGIEMIHTYSLIHDDLPLMDNDDFRRGKPTCHKVYGDALALLAGDALLTHAFATIAKNAQIEGISSEAVLDVIEQVSLAAGSFGMVGGQTVDVLSSGKSIDLDTLHYISTHKTGSLISVSIWAGARLAGASRRDLSAIKNFGEKLGLIFQIVDDILDVKGNQNVLGKPIGSDIRNNKNTFITILGYEASIKLVEKLSNEAKNIISNYENSDFWLQLTNFISKRHY